MFRFIESIKILNGRCYNLKHHQIRMLKTQQQFYGMQNLTDIRKFLFIPQNLKTGLVKCRIEYDNEIRKIEFSPYAIRKIHSAKIVDCESLNYPFKFVERPELDAIFSQKGQCDEIIIIKDGLITDAYYYNLVFEQNGKYYTPAIPMLEGTRRQLLLDKGTIIRTEITPGDIQKYQNIHFINALTGLNQCVIKTAQVVF